MHAQDDGGTEINAEFTVEADGPHLSLILESGGGRGSRGIGGRPRNDQYVPALRLLLRRLGERHAVLLSALVTSARVSALPERERILLEGPLDLAGVSDIEQLRLDITRPQGHVALGAGVDSNNRRRLQLRLDVPGYGPGDAHRLAADLAAPPLLHHVLPTAGELLQSLIGEEFRTVTGKSRA